MKWWWGPLCSRPTHWTGGFHNVSSLNSPRVKMSFHSETLFNLSQFSTFPVTLMLVQCMTTTRGQQCSTPPGHRLNPFFKIISWYHLIHAIDRQLELFQQDNARLRQAPLPMDYLEQNKINALPWLSNWINPWRYDLYNCALPYISPKTHGF
jgi:hypothetical protein